MNPTVSSSDVLIERLEVVMSDGIFERRSSTLVTQGRASSAPDFAAQLANFLQSRGQVKIAYLHGDNSVIMLAENVLWLEVAMCNAAFVQEVECSRDVTNNQRRLKFGEVTSSFQMTEERPTEHLFEYHEESIFFLKIFDQLQDVGLSL